MPICTPRSKGWSQWYGSKILSKILVFLLGVLPDSVFSLPGNAAFSLVAGYHHSLSFGTFFLVRVLVFKVL